MLGLALLLSLMALAAERFEGPSYFWSVDGELVVCETARPPWESSRRTMKHAPIVRFDTAPHPELGGVPMLSVYFDMISFNIPQQNGRVIRHFDAYVEGLNRFLARIREGRLDSRFAHRDPWYLAMLISGGGAVLVWVVLFSLLWWRR